MSTPNRLAIILDNEEVSSLALDLGTTATERRLAIEADVARLTGEAEGLEQKLRALRESIGNAEEHLRATEAAIRAGDIKRLDVEKELAQLKRKLAEATA